MKKIIKIILIVFFFLSIFQFIPGSASAKIICQDTDITAYDCPYNPNYGYSCSSTTVTVTCTNASCTSEKCLTTSCSGGGWSLCTMSTECNIDCLTDCIPECPSGCSCGSNNSCCGAYCGSDTCGGSCGYESDSDVGSGCSSPCSCGSNDYCCGESCGTDVCGNDCGSESDDNHWTGCDSGCSCGSNDYCCGADCGTSVCGNDCGNESDSDVNTSTGCNSCSPACGQDAGTNVCGTDCGTCSTSSYGDGCTTGPNCGGDSSYCGSDCGNDVCDRDVCGSEADYRSGDWSMTDTVTHDIDFNVSGHAEDANGSYVGVEEVEINFSGGPTYTIPVDANTGDFSDSFPADFYTSGLDGSESFTAEAIAYPRESDDCGAFSLGTNTLTITNNGPSNGSITIEGTSDGNLSGNDLCVDYDTNNDQIVSVTATFSDVDSYPSPRFSDIEQGMIIFDNDNNYDNGEFYRVEYQDNGSGNVTISEVSNPNGSSHLDQLSISNTSSSFNNSTGTLTVNFDLNLNGIGATNYFVSNIDMNSWDFAGVEAGRETKASDIEFWNCDDVLVDGTVFNITDAYPLDSCGDLDPANSTGLDNVNLSFDDLGDGESSDTTAGDGTYSVTLNYLSNYNFSLLSATRAFTHIVNLNSDGLVCDCGPDCDSGCPCPTGLDIETTEGATFTVDDGPVITGLDFGMVLALDQWLQVVGGDATSYGTIDNSIPDTCQTDYNNGGSCLPFTTVDRRTASGASLFRENGIAAAFGTISSGDGSVGDPYLWSAANSSIQPPRSRGYAYFSNKLGSDYNEPATSLSNMTLSGDPLIRLVNGTMTVDEDYTVAENDFALFIVSGDLNINSDVQDLHGIFLVDGSINVSGNDTSPQGLFEGVFIADANSSGAGQINNNRDREIANNLAPSSVFEYRQDMVVSLLTEPVLTQALESTKTWEEVKP